MATRKRDMWSVIGFMIFVIGVFTIITMTITERERRMVQQTTKYDIQAPPCFELIQEVDFMSKKDLKSTGLIHGKCYIIKERCSNAYFVVVNHPRQLSIVPISKATVLAQERK